MSIICGDSIEIMKTFPECSIDALVSDPPYGLGFMGKDWDIFSPKEFQDFSFQWGTQALRILKPGAYLTAFSGSRTYHRMVCGLEDSGFKIMTLMIWAYSSGFPKSLDISKAIDKHLGVEFKKGEKISDNIAMSGGNYTRPAPFMEEAKKWEGWYTQLKPALEPIVLAQKPREGTFAENEKIQNDPLFSETFFLYYQSFSCCFFY